ncbi:MAG: hypothetical protein Harvfovirus57_6 [Harvfovirus sp.]|uniref:BTB domain-containing protein n=1 Tax=Harvfovirus sp. TaxID=2487768 RepID=A0A3G5A3E9_9VIRU|nr:MAG: hypothetical protein Harvfovirus57_6 [Harvfovirus sp.]
MAQIKKESNIAEEIIADEGEVKSKILRILNNNKGDITIKSKDGSITAFREILMETSEPLKIMLSDKFSEHREKTISFETYGSYAVKYFIYYIHGDIKKYPRSFNQTFDLLELCELYGLKNYTKETIENIVEYTNSENAIISLCLCEKYLRINDSSKKIIIKECQRRLFEDFHEMTKQYFIIKKELEKDRSLESKGNTVREKKDVPIDDDDDVSEEDRKIINYHERYNMLEKMIEEFFNKRISISLTEFNSDGTLLKIDNEQLKLYPILKKIFIKNESVYYIGKSNILYLQSTDDYIITKRTYEEIEFIFLE